MVLHGREQFVLRVIRVLEQLEVADRLPLIIRVDYGP